MERTAPFEAWVENAQTYLRACQAELDKKYQLGLWPRYDWYQETRQLIFSEDRVATVAADEDRTVTVATPQTLVPDGRRNRSSRA